MRSLLPFSVGVLAFAALGTAALPAHALLIDQGPAPGPLGVELTHHYPYPSTLTYIDEGYAFDDDPLTALVRRPYFMPVVLPAPVVRESLVQPRLTFVAEMVHSADGM